MTSKANDYRALHKDEADASQAAFVATLKDDLATGKAWADWLGPGLLPLMIAFLLATIVAGRHATTSARVIGEIARRLRGAFRRD